MSTQDNRAKHKFNGVTMYFNDGTWETKDGDPWSDLYADTDQEWSQIDAVFAVMPEAAEDAGEIFDARDLYYQVRPRIQELGIEKLDGPY